MAEFKKRETAFKLRIGDLLRGNQIFEETESQNKRLKFIELGNKQILRVNIIANVVDKFTSDGETRFASITIDDGSGQIRARLFGEDIHKFEDLTQGDTLVIIGLLRVFNQELYLIPELIKKLDPKYLLVRKLEIDRSYKSEPEIRPKQKILILREEITNMIKEKESSEGIDKEELIMKIKAPPELINQEITKLLEEGIIYEPRPGRVRYLG
jgi:RPA family protein